MLKKKVQVVVYRVTNNTVQILILQTKKDRNEHWQNVTGAVDPGEDFLDAAKRELFEETGINSEVTPVDLEFKFHDRWGKDVIEKVYFSKLNEHDFKIKISDEEHQGHKWININDINENTLGYPSYLEAIREVEKSIC